MRKPDRHASALVLLLSMVALIIASAAAFARGTAHYSARPRDRGPETASGELVSTASPSVRIDADGEVISKPAPPTSNELAGGPSRTGSHAAPDDVFGPTGGRRLQQ